MTACYLIPVCLSAMLIAAHFFRAGSVVLACLCCAAPLMLLIPKCLAARAVQCCLGLAALEWCRILYGLVQERITAGTPWLRLAIIIGAVTVLAAASAFSFQADRLKYRYKL